MSFSLALGQSSGLPFLYNQAAETAASEGRILITVHDDLAIVDLYFWEKIALALDEFSVVGLCGCQTPENEAHTAWFSSTAIPSGQIGTCLKDSEEAVLTCNLASFGQSPCKSVEMDGVFLAFDPAKVPTRFDPDFRYHHYDVDFTLRAHRGGYRCGTWPIFTVHVSNSGDGYQSRSWRDSSEIFIEKWKHRK